MTYALLHNIRSLYNIGAMFRTSDGVGLSKLYLTGYTAHPPSAQLRKTALGAEQSVFWEYHRDQIPVLKRLKAKAVHLLALETMSGAKKKISFRPPIIFLSFGWK